MSYSLHYAQHYAPDWKYAGFNWNLNEWANLFYGKFYDNGWHNDEETEFEVDRADIEAYVTELKKLEPQADNEFFDGETTYTNAEVIEVLNEILKSDDTLIRLEWF